MSEVTEVRTEWTPTELAAEIAGIVRRKKALWNQGSYFSRRGTVAGLRGLLADDDEAHPCGTTACVAGWAAVLTTPPGTRIDSGGSVQIPNAKGGFSGGGATYTSAFALGREVLGLSATDADWLFSGGRDEEDVLSALDSIASGEEWHNPNYSTENDCDCCCCTGACDGAATHDED